MRRDILLFALVLCLTGCSRTGKLPEAQDSLPERNPKLSLGTIRFSDIAREAGISFTQGHQGRTPLTILETAGTGCAFVDIDSDGWLDIFLVGQPHCALYRNKKNGTFEDISQETGVASLNGTFMGVATADISGDGFPDLFVTGYRQNALLLSEKGTRFRATSLELGKDAWTTSAVFTELDGDGRLDLAVGSYLTFQETSRQSCAFGDVLAACPPFYYPAQKLRAWRGDGAGRFTETTRAWGLDKSAGYTLGVAAADGLLYVANDGVPGDLWQRRGERFENIGTATSTAYNSTGGTQAGMGVDWGDYDNDGQFDLVVTTFQEEPTALYRHETRELFRDTSAETGMAALTRTSLGFGTVLTDFDSDGWLDSFTANGHVQDSINRYRPPATYAQPTLCLRGGKPGRFTKNLTGTETPLVGRGVAVGDFDNDGRPDVLVANLEGRAQLLHNDSPLPPAWIGLDVPLGTQVRWSDRAGSHIVEARTGRAYLSASDPRLLIPVLDPKSPPTLRLRWPSGKTQALAIRDKLGRYHTLREGGR